MVRFSIIVINYNGISFLKRCFDSLERQTYSEYEIIFVDNASVDGSAIYIKTHFPLIYQIRNTINRGYAGGCNDGAKVAKGEYLIFLNNDTFLPPEFLSNLNEGINFYPGYGMYAPKMIYPDGRINSTGICISLSGAAWDRGMGEQDMNQYEYSDEVFGPCGGAAVIKKSAFYENGKFDEDFFLFMEDIDLIFRLQSTGWKCRYLPSAVIYHYHGSSAGVNSDISVYYGNRNIIWNIIKNYPATLLFFSCIWICARFIGGIIYYCIQGRGRIILKAKIDACVDLPSIIKKRRKIQQRRISSAWYSYLHLFSKSH